MEDRVQKYYPVQGTNKFETTSMPMVKSFRVDAGAQAVGTDTTLSFPKGSMILGFQVKVTEAVTSAGSATVQFGFTGKTMLSAAIAKATLVEGYVAGPDESADAAVYVLPADDTFDIIVGTADLTAGKFDIHVLYVPAPAGELDSTNFPGYTTA